MMFARPHRRLNALTGEWVLVSPHRATRPWQGSEERAEVAAIPQHDPHCYLCPGNARANGDRNPKYTSTFVFDNDFSALLPGEDWGSFVAHAELGTEPNERGGGGEDVSIRRGTLEIAAAGHSYPLLHGQAASGTCRVLCFSPRHDLAMAQMSTAQIRAIVDLWAQQTDELGRRWRWVQVFENKGQLMGCSNPHPHGQVWAGDFLPNEAVKELAQQQAWFKEKGAPLLTDYAALEAADGTRTVIDSQHWQAVVPWWAVWPFETLLLPRRHMLRFPELSSEERDDLAGVLQRLLAGYDSLFGTSFPYSMGWHGAPHDEGDYQGWQLHAHFYPPLLRSAAVRKFMVGYEMLAEAQRDLTAEQAAERLRAAIG